MVEVYLKKAEHKDMDLLFNWANDEAVRKNSFNIKKIDYESHQKWFLEKLESDRCVIYIYHYKDEPIGQIRVDIENNIGLIDYSIDSNYRLQGHGLMILTLIEVTIKAEYPFIRSLCAKVKNTNIASQKKFDQLLYKKNQLTEYIEYVKEIDVSINSSSIPCNFRKSGGGG